jgi:hypothetical protein
VLGEVAISFSVMILELSSYPPVEEQSKKSTFLNGAMARLFGTLQCMAAAGVYALCYVRIWIGLNIQSLVL